MRHEEFEINSLKKLIKEIKQTYGSITLENLNKASIDNPNRIPSYKTFVRKLGSIKKINNDVETY